MPNYDNVSLHPAAPSKSVSQSFGFENGAPLAILFRSLMNSIHVEYKCVDNSDLKSRKIGSMHFRVISQKYFSLRLCYPK